MNHSTVAPLAALLVFQSFARGQHAGVADILARTDRVVASGPFEATWPSLEKYAVPAWYKDAKFGIFIHWGVYSVPAFGNEWYPRNMYIKDSAEFKHHLATYGDQAKFGYKDFVPALTAEKFDADQWAELFRKSGAKFVVPVAEHHDGFAMYDCSLSDWCAAKVGPKRDVVGLLARAVRAKGLTFGLSTHRAEHWWYFNGGRQFDSDVKDEKYGALYAPAQPEPATPTPEFLDDWMARTCELVDKYQPAIVWFDWWIEKPAFEPYRKRFAAYYYNAAAKGNYPAAINYKGAAYPDKAAVLDIERGQLAGIRAHFWQTDTSISKNSWGYVKEQDYKTAGSIIGDLIDIVSKNGALLLNIGPRADGTIPEKEQEILLEIGKWLSINGEAVYGARPWRVFGEGPTQVKEGSFTDTARGAFTSEDIRFTTRGKTLYATVLAWPSDGKVTIRLLAPDARAKISSISLLGSGTSLKWSSTRDALVVEGLTTKPCDHAYVLKISPVDGAMPD